MIRYGYLLHFERSKQVTYEGYAISHNAALDDPAFEKQLFQYVRSFSEDIATASLHYFQLGSYAVFAYAYLVQGKRIDTKMNFVVLRLHSPAEQTQLGSRWTDLFVQSLPYLLKESSSEQFSFAGLEQPKLKRKMQTDLVEPHFFEELLLLLLNVSFHREAKLLILHDLPDLEVAKLIDCFYTFLPACAADRCAFCQNLLPNQLSNVKFLICNREQDASRYAKESHLVTADLTECSITPPFQASNSYLRRILQPHYIEFAQINFLLDQMDLLYQKDQLIAQNDGDIDFYTALCVYTAQSCHLPAFYPTQTEVAQVVNYMRTKKNT